MRAARCPIAMNRWFITPIVIGMRRKGRAYSQAANETSYCAGGNRTAVTRSGDSRRRQRGDCNNRDCCDNCKPFHGNLFNLCHRRAQYVAGLVRFAYLEVSPDSVSSGLTKQALALNASKNWQSSLQNTKSLHSNFLLYLREPNACGLIPPARFA
jgi:hypothetical protein